jgi:hypothetical protein
MQNRFLTILPIGAIMLPIIECLTDVTAEKLSASENVCWRAFLFAEWPGYHLGMSMK